jgi:hypothetical protein
MAQAVEFLLCKCKTLSSNTCATKKLISKQTKTKLFTAALVHKQPDIVCKQLNKACSTNINNDRQAGLVLEVIFSNLLLL